MGAYESLPAGFTIADARSALLFLSGLAPSVEADLTRLDIVKDDSSAGVLNIRDAARLARKTAGLETNL